MRTDALKKYEEKDNKWAISRELGSGSFGSVYEIVRKDFPDMKSALKVISIPNSSSEIQSFREDNYDMDEQSVTAYFYGFVEEFVKEFQIMAQMRGHSNIVSYEDHDIIPHEGGIGWDIFIRMELLTPMNSYFSNHAPTGADVIKLGIDICNALDVCSKYKIIHRDIKPSNIFISPTGDYKLGDFGVARTMEKTSSGMSKKGTYTFMAPEVFKNEPYGANVDIYSLGIMMYKIINGNMEPFRTDRTYEASESALNQRLSGAEMPPPCNADPALAQIILKACAYSPTDRYQTAAEMRDALMQLSVVAISSDAEEKNYSDSTEYSSTGSPFDATVPPLKDVPEDGTSSIFSNTSTFSGTSNTSNTANSYNTYNPTSNTSAPAPGDSTVGVFGDRTSNPTQPDPVKEAPSSKPICKRCNSPLKEDAKFCGKCGAPVATQSSQEQRKLCSKCGLEIKSGSKFCGKCGTPLEEHPIQAKPRFCPKCGFTIKEGSKFCGKCGSPIAQQQPQQPLCPKCKLPINPGAKFCGKCGMRIN